jgi:DNA-binding CsgD family transcriptional regulator
MPRAKGVASAGGRDRRQPLVRAGRAGIGESPTAPDRVAERRRMLAELCKLLGTQAGKPPQATPEAAVIGRAALTPIDPALPRRQRQTLELLLQGDGEKQIAGKLGLSPHTVHIYVKSLHKRFAVSSRSELLARFIPRGNRLASPSEGIT